MLFKIIVVISILFQSKLLLINGGSIEQSIVLDKETDIFRNWKLRGNYFYYPNGKQLRLLGDMLPQDFEYNNFIESKGIWIIFPESQEIGQNGSASFTYNAAAQLFNSLSVTYAIGGNLSTLVIKTHFGNEPLYTLSQSLTPAYEWAKFDIEFPGTSQFGLEATVHGPKSYILIDKIVGFVQVTTTTTSRPPRPKTTKSTTPKPVSKATQIHLSLILILAYFVLIVDQFF